MLLFKLIGDPETKGFLRRLPPSVIERAGSVAKYITSSDESPPALVSLLIVC